MVNDNGGINGRKITFITYDDGYTPPKAVEMVRKLVEDDKVLLVFQTLGTPSNSAIHKYMNQKKVPQLFVATGASKWGNPKEFPWTMGWQPDYATEGGIYAKHILASRPGCQDRRADAERRLRQGLLQRLQGRPRQGRRQDRAGCDLRGG
jgi:branched-chain amino acid transport system substrate-binding protein